MAYDPVGALNGLFAPAYIHGNAESDQAVQNWMVAHPRSPGVGTFVPNATAAATPVAQPAAQVAQPAAQPAAQSTALNDQRNSIANALIQQNTAPPGYGASILGQSDWNTFYRAAGADAANAWAQQQFMQANSPAMLAQQRAYQPTYSDSFGGGSGTGGEAG